MSGNVNVINEMILHIITHPFGARHKRSPLEQFHLFLISLQRPEGTEGESRGNLIRGFGP